MSTHYPERARIRSDTCQDSPHPPPPSFTNRLSSSVRQSTRAGHQHTRHRGADSRSFAPSRRIAPFARTRATHLVAVFALLCAPMLPAAAWEYERYPRDLLFMVTVLANGSAGCIIECAVRFPDLGREYQLCVLDCGPIVIQSYSDPGDSDQSSIDRGLVYEATQWAREIQHMRSAGADPEDVLRALRQFLEADWQIGVRERLVDPLFVGVVAEMARDANHAFEPAYALQQMLSDIAQVEALEQVSPMGRAGVLAVCVWAGSVEDSNGFHQALELYAIGDEVELLTRVIEARSTLLPPDSPPGGLGPPPRRGR